MGEIPAWSVEDGEVLHGDGVAILQAAVRQSARLDFPATTNGRQRIGGGPAAFLQPIQRKHALTGRGDVGQLLDLEILWLLLDLHEEIIRTPYSGAPAASRKR